MGWTVRGSNPGGGEIFRTCPDRPWGQTSLMYNGYRVFPGDKERPVCDADPSPLLVPWSRKSIDIPSSLYGPYGLYRASLPVQYSYISSPHMGRTACTKPQCLYSIAIPLLPSVPVQYSYTSTPPMGRTACTEPQCLYSIAISLVPLWAVRPVQSLSACTKVHFTFHSAL